MEDHWIGLIAAGAALGFCVAVVILCRILWRKYRPCCKPTNDDVENQAATSGESGVENSSTLSGNVNQAFQPIPAHVSLVSPGVVAGQGVRLTILDEQVRALQRTSLATDDRGRSIQLQRLDRNTIEQQILDHVEFEQRRLEQNRQEEQRKEQERLKQEILKQQRIEQHRLKQVKIEQQRLELQRLEKQRLEQERLKQQTLEQERLKQQTLELKRLEQLRLEQKRLEQQRFEQLRLEKQKLDPQRLRQERLEVHEIHLQQNVRQTNTRFLKYDDEGDVDEENDENDIYDNEEDDNEDDDRRQNKKRGRSRERNLNKTRHRSNSGDFLRQRVVTDSDKKIDLHSLSVKDAMYIFRQFLQEMENDYHNSNYRRVDRFIHVITGRGLHSDKGIPKIKPEVQKHLDRYCYDHEWKNNGGLVTIDLLSKRRSFM
ncbi:hypothetical protein Btru_011967 [Bulinus truncatus]|nr:hypothetical protein Btru_011967 [Bulinus truncatus]